ncbi:hypothetical protein PRIPAC_78354 [Pristionchus pacificus]|uniref:UDP-glucuronosyltransferase n=1 Tax=Pristionchus pacificus TaxID=54126 RepID=A0A2A6C3V2_PRIPA|nr:hypothetical protein PRIPAC_78354 [Pristionchus pacificus]|eukprot:PDM72787.1 Glycosyltransferase [Pristionchus pacificus]
MRGHCALALSLLLASQLSESYKFLGFSPQWAVSHVNYLGKIADSLVDAGHEVVLLAPRVDPTINGAGTKKARIIEIPENEFSRRWNSARIRTNDLYWNGSVLEMISEGSELFKSLTLTMNATAHYPGLIEQLRAENFDAAYTEDPAGFGIFHMAGIEKTVFAMSFTSMECSYAITQSPSAPSYVPSIFFAPWGDQMSFWQRIANTFASFGWAFVVGSRIDWLQPIFEGDFWEMVTNNSLVLLNSEPLLDFPRPTVHRVIDIGGIVMSSNSEPLDEYWSEVMNRRNRTVILSFGTYIKASTMPEVYKETIRKALAKFDDVTFIWKYESPEHDVSQGIDNIVVSTWIPQVALLNDARLTAFITHGGQGSTLEAAYAGIPMLMLPTQGDQYRNAAMIKRAGLGEIVRLGDLEGGNRFEEAIRNLLDNEKYTIHARKTAAMLKDRPFSAKEKLVRNMEFLAKYGPLRMLNHEGRNLNFIQYYLIDVIFFVGFITVLVLGLISLCCVASCRFCCNRVRRRYNILKQE